MVAAPGKLEFLLMQGELDFVISDPVRIAGLPVIEWRSRLAWLASTDFSIDPAQEPAARTLPKHELVARQNTFFLA